MKIKHLFLALLALPLFFAACEPDQKEPTPAPTLKLTSEATLSFEAEGGEGSLSYELKNAVEGTAVEAAADVEWINNFTVEAAAITFTVEANEGEARSGKVTATYGDLSIFVTVNQGAKGGNDDPQPEVSTWTVVGTINNWDVANGLQMFVTEDGYHAALGVELTAEDKVKFVNNGSWDENRGGNNDYVVEANYFIAASHNGKDVAFAAAGKYDLYLNAELDKIYVMAEGKLPAEAKELKYEEPEVTTWDVMGDFQDNNWTTPYELVKGDQYYVAQDVVFANANNEGLAFKVRKNANWDTSYGTADGATYELGAEIALDGTSNIFVNGTVGEKYDIYFDEANMKVWVMQDGLKPGETPVEPGEPLNITFTSAVVSKDAAASAGYMQLTFSDETNTLVVEFVTETDVIENGTYLIDATYGKNTIYALTSKLNGKKLDSGEAVVSRDGTNYYVSFNNGSADGGAQLFSGIYNGTIAFEDGSLMGAPKNEVITVENIQVGYRAADGSEMELVIYQSGEMPYSHVIDFLPSTPNQKLIEAGTYSVAAGTIDPENSTYRYSSSMPESLTEAEFTLSHDTDAGTTTIVGTFTTVSGQPCSIEWTGKVSGFDFSTGEDGINVTEWGNVNIKTWSAISGTVREYMFSGYSADGTLEINLDCYYYPNNSDKVWPEGTYNVESWKKKDDYIAAGEGCMYCAETSYGNHNGVRYELKSGTVTVKHVDGEYDITFDVVTTFDENLKGHYVGGIGEYGSAALP